MNRKTQGKDAEAAEADEVAVRLALLSVPECRARAGLPARGPLTRTQIADYAGLSVDGIRKIERRALGKIKEALRDEREKYF